MKRPLVVGPVAEREIVTSARWYEARELGLGRAFVDEVLRAFAHGRRRPGYWDK